MKETRKRKKVHSYVEQAHVDAEIYKELIGEKPKDVSIESFFEDGIHFGRQRIWVSKDDVDEY